MRRYTARDEEKMRVQGRVREWKRAGLLGAAQAGALDDRLHTDLRRTNILLRAVLAVFTAAMWAAAVGLVYVVFEIRGDTASAVTFAIAGLVAIAAAGFLVAEFRLYRYGIEEASTLAAVVFFALSAAWIVSPGGSAWRLQFVAGLFVASGALFLAYLRYGFLYAAIGAILCGALVPFPLDLEPVAQRGVAIGVVVASLALTRLGRSRSRAEHLRDEFVTLEAAAWAMLYLFVNLKIGDLAPLQQIDRLFYWLTYVAIWILPAAALCVAVAERERTLLAVGIGMALATLATNKPYLGWPRHTWDPMLLGVLLIGTALALRRWLASGVGGQRGGFTAVRILESDRDVITFVATASAAWPRHGRHVQPAPESPPPFEGGRSGGGGGGAEF
jgi:hypothetical protein